MDWKLPREGECRCGRVRIRVTKPPLLTMACHCAGCQKMSSSAFSLSAAIPADGFEVVAGEPVVGGLHGASKHMFCGWCMTWMFTRPEGLDWLVNVRPTMLEGAADFAPFIETWTSEKLEFARTGAVKSYEALPAEEEYEELVREFGEWAPISPLAGEKAISAP